MGNTQSQFRYKNRQDFTETTQENIQFYPLYTFVRLHNPSGPRPPSMLKFRDQAQ